MKKLIFISILTFVACVNKEVNEIPHFKEKNLSFGFLKVGYDTSNEWIKEPKNIEVIHETFKSIGYNRILDYLDWTEDWTLQIDSKKSLKNLIDSLHISHSDTTNITKYYKEFWQRRSKQGNSEITYKVIDEIKSLRIGDSVAMNPNAVNDTLKYLGEIELKDSLDTSEAKTLLNYLIKSGMHQSAWNVRSGENSKYDEIQWNTEPADIYEKLNISEEYIKPWIIDNTK